MPAMVHHAHTWCIMHIHGALRTYMVHHAHIWVPAMVHHAHTWAQHHQPAYPRDATSLTSPKALSAHSTTPMHQQLTLLACLPSLPT